MNLREYKERSARRDRLEKMCKPDDRKEKADREQEARNRRNPPLGPILG